MSKSKSTDTNPGGTAGHGARLQPCEGITPHGGPVQASPGRDGRDSRPVSDRPAPSPKHKLSDRLWVSTWTASHKGTFP